MLRLICFVTALFLLALVGTFVIPTSPDGLQATIHRFGPLAAPVFVVLSALLGLVFFPGPLLAAVGGALFGTWLGFISGLVSAALSAVLALMIARRAAAPAVEELSGERIRALTDLARHHGTVAVVVQRLIPGIPDTPLSYAFGMIGLRVRQIVLGTVIGSAPRAFAYTALGDAALTGDTRLAITATVVGSLASLVGLAVGGLLSRWVRTGRRTGPEPVADAPSPQAEFDGMPGLQRCTCASVQTRSQARPGSACPGDHRAL